MQSTHKINYTILLINRKYILKPMHTYEDQYL